MKHRDFIAAICSREAINSPYRSTHSTRYDAVAGAKGRSYPYADAKKKQSASGETVMKIWLRMAAVAVAVCLAAVSSAQAQTYPSKPITIIVPASPGGVTDMLARILAQHFNADWGAQTVVENKPGANNQ